MTNTNQQGQLYRLKKWVDDNYPNFNKSDIESKIDELIVEDGKQGGEVSNDEKNFNVRIRAKIDRILRDLGVWDMLLHDSENWSDYTELRDKIYSSVGTIEPTDLLPNFKFQPFTPVQDGFTLKDIGKALCVFLTTQIAKDKCDLYETPEVFASEFIKELNQFYHTY